MAIQPGPCGVLLADVEHVLSLPGSWPASAHYLQAQASFKAAITGAGSLALSSAVGTRHSRQTSSKLLRAKAERLSGAPDYPTKNPTNLLTNRSSDSLQVVLRHIGQNDAAMEVQNVLD